MFYLFILPLFILTSLADDSLQSSLIILDQVNTGNAYQCTEDTELMNRCALDLCGNPASLPSSTLNDRSFNKYVQSNDMKKFANIEKDLKAIIELEIDRTNNLVQGFKKSYQSDDLKRVVESAEPWDVESLASRFLYPFFHVSSDYSKPLNERLTYQTELPPDASDVLKKGLESYINHRKAASLANFSVGIQEGLYSPEESKEIIKNEWIKFTKNYEERKKTNPDSLKTFSEELEGLKKDMENPQFAESGNLDLMAGSLQHLTEALKSEEQGKWPDVPNYHCLDDCKKAVQEEINRMDYNGAIQGLESKLKDRKSLAKKKLAYCKSQFAMDSINSYQKDKLIKMIPGIKNALFKNVMSGYSKSSQQEFKDYLDKQVHFATKPMKSRAEGFIQEVKRVSQFGNKPNAEAAKVPLIDSALSIMDLVDNEGNVFPLSQMNLCGESLSFIAWDNFTPKSFRNPEAPPEEYAGQDPEKDNLNISMFSCTHQDHGKGIVAHELGHALSWAFLEHKLSESSYAEYMKMRSCANGMYKVAGNEQKPVTFVHENDRFRVEEDMADLIGYMTIPDKSLISNCTLLEVSDDGKSFENLELRNSRNIDTHSSPLMRTLQEAIHKRRELPASCKELVSANKDLYRFEPCY